MAGQGPITSICDATGLRHRAAFVISPWIRLPPPWYSLRIDRAGRSRSRSAQLTDAAVLVGKGHWTSSAAKAFLQGTIAIVHPCHAGSFHLYWKVTTSDLPHRRVRAGKIAACGPVQPSEKPERNDIRYDGEEMLG